MKARRMKTKSPRSSLSGRTLRRAHPSREVPSHGSPLGEENISEWKKSIGWDYEPFTVPAEVYDYLADFAANNRERENAATIR